MNDKKRLAIVETSIQLLAWYPFGKKEFECIGLSEEAINFYQKNNQLPNPCDICYKALIFWTEVSDENLLNFLKMLDSFEVNYRGKLNKGVVVFYFRDKEKMLKFLEFLQSKIKEFNVKGRIQWRRACKGYQDLNPELWRNAKEFIPDLKNVPPKQWQQRTF
jgi:hypothetical protein